MSLFSNALNLMSFLSELPKVAERADTERLMVLLPAFKRDFPDLWEELVYCSKMKSPSLVVSYLVTRDQRLVFLKSVPNIEQVVQFLMNFIRERCNDDSIPSGDSSVVFANPRRRKRPTKRVHA